VERGTRVCRPAAGSTGGDSRQPKYSDAPICRARLRHSCRLSRAGVGAHGARASVRTSATRGGPTSPSARGRLAPGSAAPSPCVRPRNTACARPTALESALSTCSPCPCTCTEGFGPGTPVFQWSSRSGRFAGIRSAIKFRETEMDLQKLIESGHGTICFDFPDLRKPRPRWLRKRIFKIPVRTDA
jgi:hypothetical protein